MSIEKMRQQALGGSVFKNGRLAEEDAKHEIIPAHLREDLKRQWKSPFHYTSRVYIRAFNESTGTEYFVTGWDGFASVAALTRKGFRNVNLADMAHGGVVIDEAWDNRVTISQVKDVLESGGPGAYSLNRGSCGSPLQQFRDLVVQSRGSNRSAPPKGDLSEAVNSLTGREVRTEKRRVSGFNRDTRSLIDVDDIALPGME